MQQLLIQEERLAMQEKTRTTATVRRSNATNYIAHVTEMAWDAASGVDAETA